MSMHKNNVLNVSCRSAMITPVTWRGATPGEHALRLTNRHPNGKTSFADATVHRTRQLAEQVARARGADVIEHGDGEIRCFECGSGGAHRERCSCRGEAEVLFNAGLITCEEYDARHGVTTTIDAQGVKTSTWSTQ